MHTLLKHLKRAWQRLRRLVVGSEPEVRFNLRIDAESAAKAAELNILSVLAEIDRNAELAGDLHDRGVLQFTVEKGGVEFEGTEAIEKIPSLREKFGYFLAHYGTARYYNARDERWHEPWRVPEGAIVTRVRIEGTLNHA